MEKTKQLTVCAIMISLALVLSYMERWIPLQMLIPLPGIKLGLANIITLIALYLLGIPNTCIILVLRCILGSFFGGGISGLMFSLTGGLLAVAVMTAAKRVSVFSVYGVSVLGAAAHHIGQIGIAMIFMRSVYVGAYLPYLLIAGVVTGLATGAACSGVLKVLLSTSHSGFSGADVNDFGIRK